jgi:hypothetical protein
MNKTIYIRRNYYNHGELYGVSIIFKFSTIDDMSLYVTAQLQKANSNDATTGHNLQGMSKQLLIVSSWPTGGLAAMFKNWEYVVLSQVQTLSGLYLVKPIDMEKSFKPSKEQRSYIESARKKEKNMLER